MKFRINTGAGDASPPPAQKTIKERIEQAKIDGMNEIELFKQAHQEFNEKVKDLALFSETIKQTDEALEQLIDNLLTPLMQGKAPAHIPQEVLNQLRKEMFHDLITKYQKEN